MENEPINNNHIFGYVNVEQLMDGQVITEIENIMTNENLGLFVNNSNLHSLQSFLINNKLPDNLLDLECDDNFLTKLPDLPDNLEWLSCNNNKLTKLPYLPDSLQYLYCDDNNLKNLPELPDGIKEVNCTDNNIEGEITYLPDNIEIFCCSNNKIQSIPELPQSLLELECNQNNLRHLPDLENTRLIKLNCSDNNITELPDLPASLRELYCRNNPFDDESIQKIIAFYEKDSTKKYTGTEMNVEEELKYFNLFLSKVVNNAFIGMPDKGPKNPESQIQKTTDISLSQKPTHLILDYLNYQKPPPPPSQTGGKTKKQKKRAQTCKPSKKVKSNKNKTKHKKTKRRKINKLK